MRGFSREYLRRTRRGMWDDSRAALSDLDLPGRERILDVGCGTGELTRVLAEESPATVVGVDADPSLLPVAAGRDVTGPEHGSGGAEAAGRTPVAGADATRLPFRDDSFDLVACQALLVNLPEPAPAVSEFARVSSYLVAAIEPDNDGTTVTSTVDDEAAATRRLREAYVDGVPGDLTLGGDGVEALFADAGLSVVGTRRYEHAFVVEPPYDEDDLAAARRKATGESLAEGRETLRSGGLDEAGYERLRERWRAMGRRAVEQMRAGDYRRVETIPFHVTVGRVPAADGA